MPYKLLTAKRPHDIAIEQWRSGLFSIARVLQQCFYRPTTGKTVKAGRGDALASLTPGTTSLGFPDLDLTGDEPRCR